MQCWSDGCPGAAAWAQTQFADAEGAHCGVEQNVSNPKSVGLATGREPSCGAHLRSAGRPNKTTDRNVTVHMRIVC